MNLLQNRRQPRPSSSSVAKRQDLVPVRNCRRPGQQDVLDVVELQHSRRFETHCIWSSMFSKAALRRSAFLISRAPTYGYSPYSRKLGHWCSRTNLTNAGALVFQSSGNPSRFSKTVLTPYFPKRATASSVYLSKSVSKMP